MSGSSKEYVCSCGETFTRRIAFKRHLRKTGHEAAPEEEGEEQEVADGEADDEESQEFSPDDDHTVAVPLSDDLEILEEEEQSSPISTAPSGPGPLTRFWYFAVETVVEATEYLIWLIEKRKTLWALEEQERKERLHQLDRILANAAKLATVIFLFFALLLGGGILISRSWKSFSFRSTQVLTLEQQQQAQKTLDHFFSYLNQKEQKRSYELLSSEWQKNEKFDDFKENFSSFSHFKLESIDSTILSVERVRLQVKGSYSYKQERKKFVGYYTLRLNSDQEWRIENGKFEN